MNRFERLHALLSQKPRANLGFFPTPLYKLDRLSERLGVNLYVKRVFHHKTKHRLFTISAPIAAAISIVAALCGLMM